MGKKRRKRNAPSEAGLSPQLQRVLMEMGVVVVADVLVRMVSGGQLDADSNPLSVAEVHNPSSTSDPRGVASTVTLFPMRWYRLFPPLGGLTRDSMSAQREVVRTKMAEVFDEMISTFPTLAPFTHKNDGGGVATILSRVEQTWIDLLDNPDAVCDTLRDIRVWYGNRGFQQPRSTALSTDGSSSPTISIGHPCLVPMHAGGRAGGSPCSLALRHAWGEVYYKFKQTIAR